MLTEEVLLTSYNPCCKEGWPAGKHNFLSCPDTIRNDSRQEEKNIMSLGVSTALRCFAMLFDTLKQSKML